MRDFVEDAAFFLLAAIGAVTACLAVVAVIGIPVGVLIMNIDGAACSTYGDRNPSLEVRMERWSWATWDCVVDVDGSLIPLDQYRGIAND